MYEREWWLALVLPLGFSLLAIPAVKGILLGSACLDEEYVSFYTTHVRHYDEWDEWIKKTCTRTVQAGTDPDTGEPVYEEEEYDCSYREYHPERWTKINNGGSETYIDKGEFLKWLALWGTPGRWIDMRRNYYRIDGDAQEYAWDGKWYHSDTQTYTQSYWNVIKGSGHSVFGYSQITPAQAKELGLHDYPEVEGWGPEVSPLIGFPSGLGRHVKRFQYLNAVLGRTHQIHVFVLAWLSKEYGPGVVEDQKAYWQGGNKNEFVVCLGLSPTGQVDWAECFSWQDRAELDVRCRQWLMSQRRPLQLDSLAGWIERNIGLWERKQFKDFDYITPRLEAADYITLVLVILGGSLLILGILRIEPWKYL